VRRAESWGQGLRTLEAGDVVSIRSVQLTLAGTVVPLRTDLDDAMLTAVEREVSERLERLGVAAPTLPPARAALLVALEIAEALVRERQAGEAFAERVERDAAHLARLFDPAAERSPVGPSDDPTAPHGSA
jgi:hypothetical protein